MTETLTEDMHCTPVPQGDKKVMPEIQDASTQIENHQEEIINEYVTRRQQHIEQHWFGNSHILRRLFRKESEMALLREADFAFQQEFQKWLIEYKRNNISSEQMDKLIFKLENHCFRLEWRRSFIPTALKLMTVAMVVYNLLYPHIGQLLSAIASLLLLALVLQEKTTIEDYKSAYNELISILRRSSL